MLARTFTCRKQRWEYLFMPSNFSSRCYNCHSSCFQSAFEASIVGKDYSRGNFVKRCLRESRQTVSFAKDAFSLNGRRSHACWTPLRSYSSEGDGRNASEDKHIPMKDGVNFDKHGRRPVEASGSIRQCEEHARLGEQDQKEWLNNEKLAIENKKKESPFLSRREKFKNEFLRRIVPWEKITVSWETFPYFVHEHTRSLLSECVASHLKHKKFASAYGCRLTSSSGRILLQSVPGTELYRERLVRALARDLKVPLLVLDSSVLAPYDFGEDCSSEAESDDEHAVSSEECASESEAEDDNEEEWTSNAESRSDATEDEEIDVQASAEAHKKLVPFNLDEFEKVLLSRTRTSFGLYVDSTMN
uniref:Uncharacterized protein n=1 Tax=Opuntia streptacantha TaxID=393608 RepID=A0A7C9EDC7_OPUST